MKFWEWSEEAGISRWELLEMGLEKWGNVIAEENGSFGKIFTLDLGPNSSQRYVIAKTPIIPADITREEFQRKMTRFLHELNETFTYAYHPLISHHFEVKLCLGAPFVLSRKRDCTLRDYIEGEVQSLMDSVCIVIQVAHALEYCATRGLSSHQDLKPENILLDNLRVQLGDAGKDYPFGYRALMCDFGNANAFSAFGLTSGSRPYMAPEQYSQTVTGLAKADVFAIGVILHEILTGGLHPIGERTTDVWPRPLPEKGKKWTHEAVWRKWAQGTKRVHPSISEPIANVVEKCLLSDVARRHTITTLKWDLLAWLQTESSHTFQTLNLMLDYFDKTAREGVAGGWPYYEELLKQVNSIEW